MINAQAKLDRSKKARIEILEEAAQGQCASGCSGEWLTCASEVLEQNGIRKEAFATALRELLEQGRSKFRNIMICGPANSGKTFLPNPLTGSMAYEVILHVICMGLSGRCRMYFLERLSLVATSYTKA